MCEDEATSRKASEAAGPDVVVKMEVIPDLGFATAEPKQAFQELSGASSECKAEMPEVTLNKLEGDPEEPKRDPDEPKPKSDPKKASFTPAPFIWIKIEELRDIDPASPLLPADPHDLLIARSPKTDAADTQHPYATRHKKPNKRTPSLECDKCGKSYKLESKLRRHQCTVCQRPRPACPVCCKVFTKEHFLQSHMKRHEKARSFPCPECDLSFETKYALSRHMLIHENLKLFPCEVCGKRFMTAALIKPHMRTHTKEKPFECPICLKKFSHKHDMQRHCLVHNKIKHLKCEVCHKEFRKESRLKYHMRVHWTDNKPFKCLHCKKSYSHTQNIMRHYKKKHPNEEYIPPDTDAGVATKLWEALIQKKQSESVGGYIVPDMELDKVENGVVSEVNDLGLEDGYSENENGEEVTPEIVFVEPKVEQESSDSESCENDEKD